MSLRRPAMIALVALAVGVLGAVRLLGATDWDPTAFTAFGVESEEITTFAEEELEREVRTRVLQGHDGKFFFVQALDPFMTEPAEHARLLDRPEYRSQRMLYPAIAGGFGLFPAQTVVWTLIVVNVLSLALGSWAVAAIAVRHGGPAWLGLAFAMNVGLLSELYVDGAGIMAFALACVGAWAFEEERWDLAAVSLTGAVLTREVMAIFVAGVALMWFLRERRIAWSAIVPPALAAGIWALYLRWRIDFVDEVDQIRELTAVPFSGVVQALTSGRANLIDTLVIVLFLGLLVVVPLRIRKSDLVLSWGALGFAVMAPFLTVFVWQKSWDIARALAPLVTVFVVEMVLARRAPQEADGRLHVTSRTGVRSKT